MSPLEQDLKAVLGERVRAREPLATFTSFHIGGPADLMVEVESESELSGALAAAYEHSVPAFCLGAGTNLLVSDRGIRGLVVRLGAAFRTIEIDGAHVSAGAAAEFGVMVETVVARGLAGLEFGEGIPGTVGGGLVMNAGAFGGEIAKVVRPVHGVARDGQRLSLTNEQVKFAYRRTDLPPGVIITRVEFDLTHSDGDALIAKVAELKAKRSSRQPRGVPNAGSIFKNPPGNFAGRLLENCGLKGHRVGGAAFSEQHANFIINLGDAQAAEVKALIDLARSRVKEATGVWLEPEVKLVGEW
jgi:UDP-N-acetylmuramate dehydrogenase